jgi:hypothetical protein
MPDRFIRLRLGEIVADATDARITAPAGKIETAMWPPVSVALKPELLDWPCLLVSPRLCGPACGWP